MEENKVMTNENAQATEEVKESKVKSFGSKVWNGTKKHGKKIAGVIALVIAGGIGYAVGAKSKDDDYDYEVGDDVVDNAFDPTFDDVE